MKKLLSVLVFIFTFSFFSGAKIITASLKNERYGIINTNKAITCNLQDSINSTCATCCNCKGATHVYVWGGASPYTYLWNNGRTDDTLIYLSSGSYTCTVTDANGCMLTDTVFVTKGQHASISSTGVSCYGGSTGTASISIAGNYTYSWSPIGQTGSTANGLSAGTYVVTITNADTASCVQSLTVTVTQPTLLWDSAYFWGQAGCTPMLQTVYSDVSGGTLPYTYYWSTGGTNQNDNFINNCPSGPQSDYLVVKDNNGCQVTSNTVDLTDVYPLQWDVPYFSTNITCNGGSNGSITVGVCGGPLPSIYTYVFTPGGSYNSATTNYTLTGLSAGTYSVTATINNFCYLPNFIFTITQPTALQVSASVISNEACNGNNIGSILSSISGGVSPYNYRWSNSATTTSISALTAGTYSLNVTDKNGCVGTAAINITQPIAISILSDSLPDNGSCNGFAGVSVSGGTPTYTYSWTSGGTNDSIQNKCAGSYCCYITDANGCIDSICIAIPLNLTTGINGMTNTVSSKIYPDPNNGQFTLSISKGYSNSEIEIYDLVGRLVYSSKINGTITQINMGNKITGMYFYKIMTLLGLPTASGKFVVE